MPTSNKRNIVVSSLKMSVTTTVSRIFGLIRDQSQAILLGTSWASDAFTVAFQLPNLLRRLFAEGSMTASFVPVFMSVEKERGQDQAREFFASFFTLLFLILLVVTALGIALSGPLVRLLFIGGNVSEEKFLLTVRLTRIMFPYIAFISLAALLQGVLNIRNNFTVPAFTPVLLNISVIASALVVAFAFPRTFPNITVALSIGTLVGGALQVFFQIPYFLKTGYRIYPRFKFKDPDIGRVIRQFLPGILGVGIYQVNVLLSFGFAAALGEGRQSSIMFASRINELTLGVFAVSLATVMLPALSKEAAENNRAQFVDSVSYSLRLLALVTMPAAVGLFVLSPDIVSLLLKFGRFGANSVLLVSTTLQYYSIALFFIAGYRILAQSFYSLRDTRTPVYISFVSMAVNALLCYLLPPLFPSATNIAGIALANTASNTFLFFATFALLKRKLGGAAIMGGAGSLLRNGVAALVMGVFAFAGKALLLNDPAKIQLLWRLVVLIVACAVVYFGLNLLAGNEELRSVIEQLRSRFTRRPAS